VYHNYETVRLRLFRLNPASGAPIYVQLMEQIRHAIESCVLGPGDQLPAIRTLAQELVISPNTVVKAYTELDREGVIELRHGAGAFVALRDDLQGRGRQARAAANVAREFVDKLRRQGFSDAEIRRLIEAQLDLEVERVR
jgi:GntR family transcriptional regulator